MATDKVNFKITAMPYDQINKNLSASFVNQSAPNQNINVFLNGADTSDSKAAIRAALQSAIDSIDALK